MSIIFDTLLRLKPVLLILFLTFSTAIAQKQSSQPVTGLKDNSPDWTVLTNAKVITSPGQESENVQIVIQRDVIRDVRKSGSIPAGARVIDLTGKTVYPGFIDAYSEVEVSSASATQGAPHWNSTITPQLDIASLYENNATANSTYRSQGFTTRLAVPKSGIIRGNSAVVTCGAGGNDTVILRDHVFQHFLLSVSRGRGRDQYPNSPMGAVALARQTLFDAQWYIKAWSAFNNGESTERPERNDALEKLSALLSGKQSALFVTENEQYFLRANRFAEEFKLSAIMLGSGKEYQRLDAIKQTGRTIILPIAFPTAPNVGSLESARSVSLADLMHWDIAPENPSRVATAGIPLLLTSHGLTKQSDFLKNLRRSVQRGLTPIQALAALTTQPAKELGISHLVGSIAKGKLASLIITNGDIFESDNKIEEVWVAGQRFELQKKQTLDVSGNWEVVLPGDKNPWTLKLSGKGPKLTGELRQSKPQDNEDQEDQNSTVIVLSKVSIRDTRVSAVLPGKHFGYDGFVMFTLTFTGQDTLKGTGHWTTPDGKVTAMSVTPKPMSENTDEADDSKDKPIPKPAA
ncbi:MAG: amidohydrolase family protein, partial [Pseudomonadales bacterium]|nr:amidohydrolase family protein [Pseudomonadales bacterium]